MVSSRGILVNKLVTSKDIRNLPYVLSCSVLSGSIPPLRPIVSSIDTYNYKLAQYLGSLLSPHIPSNYTTKDSFTFIEEIKQLNTYGKFLISFDVTSLFTNIPLEETINIAIDTIFQNYPNVKFTRKELQKLFKISTSETHFIFNNEIYDQIDGVSMGSPLAPILANLFMGYHEKDWIEKAQAAKPTFYKRYVDDIFAVFESELDAETFHKYLNTKHKNIKFTYEKQIENKLPFLDILIGNNENLQTSVFQKKTYTGLLLNYFSFVPDYYKYGLIKTLIDRMYRINSTWTSFDIDLKNLKQVLLKNQYPLTMIDNVIKKYLQNAVNKANTGSMPVEMPNIETRYFKLPFIGMYSKATQNKIEKLCKRFCKSAKVKLVFTSNKLCQTFSYKDSCPSLLSSKIVYKFVCASCNASYVGQTHRHLTTRIDAHFGKDKKSHIYQHLMSSVDCLNACSRDCFSILDTARTKHQLRIKESLFISWLKPTLNKQKSHQYIISLSI